LFASGERHSYSFVAGGLLRVS